MRTCRLDQLLAANRDGRHGPLYPCQSNATDSQITTYAGARLDPLDPSQVTISVTRDTVSGVNFVSVTASYTFSALQMLFPIGSFPLIGRSRIALTVPS